MNKKGKRQYFVVVPIVAALMGAMAAGYFTHFFQKKFFSPKNKIIFNLFQPIPNPLNHGKIQLAVIENKGELPAEDLIVKINYPRTIQPLDYQIESLEAPSDITRSNDFLRFRIKKLPKDDFVIIALALAINEITQKDIEIVSKDGRLFHNSIKYLKLNVGEVKE